MYRHKDDIFARLSFGSFCRTLYKLGLIDDLRVFGLSINHVTAYLDLHRRV